MKKFIIRLVCILMVVCAVCMADNTAKASTNASTELSDSYFKIHYMGTVDGGNIFPWKNFMNSSSGIATLTTTHGVVIKPWLYTGIGVGAWLEYCHNGVVLGYPVFADVRLTYPNSKWRPFFNFRMGVFTGGDYHAQFQVQPSLGIKYSFKDTFGIFLRVGTTNRFRSDYSASLTEGLSLSLGFDF